MLLVTRDRRYRLTNNIEGEWLHTEGGFADWESVAERWYEAGFADEWGATIIRAVRAPTAGAITLPRHIATRACMRRKRSRGTRACPAQNPEDTVLITDAGTDVLTASPGWPTEAFIADGLTLERPMMLQL